MRGLPPSSSSTRKKGVEGDTASGGRRPACAAGACADRNSATGSTSVLKVCGCSRRTSLADSVPTSASEASTMPTADIELPYIRLKAAKAGVSGVTHSTVLPATTKPSASTLSRATAPSCSLWW